MTRVTQIVTAGFYSGTLELQCTRIPIHQLLPNQSIAFRLTTTILAGLSGVRTSTIAGALGDGDEEAVSVGIAGRTPPCQNSPPCEPIKCLPVPPNLTSSMRKYWISSLYSAVVHCIAVFCSHTPLCFIHVFLFFIFLFPYTFVANDGALDPGDPGKQGLANLMDDVEDLLH